MYGLLVLLTHTKVSICSTVTRLQHLQEICETMQFFMHSWAPRGVGTTFGPLFRSNSLTYYGFENQNLKERIGFIVYYYRSNIRKDLII
jgi:hypothetical protein